MVTVGKRATLWMNELLMDLEEVEYRIDNLKLLGSKGHHWHTGQFYGAVCWRYRQDQSAGAEDRR